MSSHPSLDRRSFMEFFSTVGLGGTLFPGALYTLARQSDEPVTVETVAAAERIAGLSFTDEERKLMVEGLNDQREKYEALREQDLSNNEIPSFVFDPTIGGTTPPAARPDAETNWELPLIDRPSSDEDLAFLPVTHLESLLRSGQVTALELTDLYLSRLEEYNPTLNAVVTLTADRAREQARQADEEISSGDWRGPLHGIPWGAKDILAVPDYPTTWGAAPYKDQVLETTAAVVERLDRAGAVLVAKLSTGALAMRDVWFGGQTKSPWNIETGSRGSSAGPGAAVSAGLVAFAIGSETYGSIISPCTQNGITGLRPTFGRVSRYGAMTLSWTMDKLGPMARTVRDCTLIFDTIHGRDERDPATVDAPFAWPPERAISDLTVGYLESAFDGEYDNRAADHQTLDVLRGMGLDLEPITLPPLPLDAINLTLEVEAAAAFDELTRSDRDDQLVQQDEHDWPNIFRRSRFVPAVEFIQANRVRTRLLNGMNDLMEEVDVFLAPPFRGSATLATNLSGHPAVVVPNAFHPIEDHPDSPRRRPGSITFISRLYDDQTALHLAHAYQQVTDFHERQPPIE